MNFWKRWLLGAYYHTSYPVRARYNAALKSAGRAPAIVLFYHRVADDRLNPWTISHSAFQRQIHWLRRHFDMVSLAEAQARIKSPHNDRPSVTITFDDGYSDNCLRALPFLVEHGVPCTYFVCSGNVLHGQPFPHDVKHGRVLAPNSPDEIRQLSEAGVEIGAHTRWHADLGRLADEQRLHEELIQPQHELQELIGKPVRYFAFPYGQPDNLSPAAFHLARGAYDGVCTAYGGYNFPGGDAFHIERIAVDEELLRLKSWVMLDRRKIRAARQKRYHVPAHEPREATAVHEEEVQEATAELQETAL